MLLLYNSMGRKIEPFLPCDPDHARMYVCGPTVYSFAHIGNARPAVVFDVLARVLRAEVPRVTFARNITDIDDKIIAAATARAVSSDAISAELTKAFHEDLAALGVLPPDIEPHATDHIAPMIAMIEELIGAGKAYAVEGHGLYHIPAFPDYGKLSGANPDEMLGLFYRSLRNARADPRALADPSSARPVQSLEWLRL